MAALSGLAASGAGCVLVVDAGLGTVQPGWTTAGDLVRDASRVLTRFGTEVRTVAVAVESDTPGPGPTTSVWRRPGRSSGHGGPTAAAGAAQLVMNGVQGVAVYDGWSPTRQPER